MHKENKKITFEFPADEYVYLKLACVKKGVSMKDLITHAVIMYIEDYEDEIDTKALGKARKEIVDSGVMSWKDLEEKLGWDKL